MTSIITVPSTGKISSVSKTMCFADYRASALGRLSFVRLPGHILLYALIGKIQLFEPPSTLTSDISYLCGFY